MLFSKINRETINRLKGITTVLDHFCDTLSDMLHIKTGVLDTSLYWVTSAFKDFKGLVAAASVQRLLNCFINKEHTALVQSIYSHLVEKILLLCTL